MSWVGDLLRAGINATGSTIKVNKPIEMTDTVTVPDRTVTSAKMALPSLQAVQATITYADFDTDSTSVVYDTGMIIPKGAFVQRTLIDSVTKFEGGSVSAATIEIGDSDGSGGTDDVDRYMAASAVDVFQDADVLEAGDVSGTALHDAADEVSVTLELTGDNGDDLTAGEATITIFYYLGVDHS